MKRWRYDSAFFRARPSLGSAIESLLADVIQHGGGQHLGAGLAALKALADDRRGNIEPRRLSRGRSRRKGGYAETPRRGLNGDPASADPLPAPWSAGNPDGGKQSGGHCREWFHSCAGVGKVSSESWPMINASGLRGPCSWRHSCSVCAVQEGGIAP